MSLTKFLFIFLLSFTLSLNATPTEREKYHDDYLKLIELIYDHYGIDIGNRDLYEGYAMSFRDKCNAEVKLKIKKPMIKVFNGNICENRIKLVNEKLQQR